jgi:hypothetical protein
MVNGKWSMVKAVLAHKHPFTIHDLLSAFNLTNGKSSIDNGKTRLSQDVHLPFTIHHLPVRE